MKSALGLILGILVMVMVISGCSEVETNDIVETTVITDIDVEEEVIGKNTERKESQITILKPKTVVTASAVDENKEREQRKIRQLLDNYDEKIKNYAFVFQDPYNDGLQGEFYVRNNIIKLRYIEEGDKIGLPIPEFNVRRLLPYNYDENHITTVFLKPETLDAYGFCEKEKRCSNVTKRFVLNYFAFETILPHQWITKIENARIADNTILDNKQVVVLEYNDYIYDNKLWVEEFSGLPLKVERRTTFENVTYVYGSMKFNRLRPEDIKPKFGEI